MSVKNGHGQIPQNPLKRLLFCRVYRRDFHLYTRSRWEMH